MIKQILRPSIIAYLLCVSFLLDGQSYFPVKVNKLWGLIDQNGKIVNKPEFEAISNFKSYEYALVQKQGLLGLINKKGEKILPIDFQDIRILDSLLFSIKKGDHWGLINHKSELILPPSYQDIQYLSKSFIAIKNEKGWGVSNLDGEILVAPGFEEVKAAGTKFFLVSQQGKKGILTSYGSEVLATEYDEILILKEDLFLVRQNSFWGIIGPDGVGLSTIRYRSFDFLSDQFIKLFSLEEIHLFSLPCKRIIVREKKNNFLPLSQQFVLIKNANKMGAINYCGKEILSGRYDEILWFSQKLFRVKSQGKWALMMEADSLHSKFKYAYISPLKQNLAIFRKDQKFGILNHKGEEIIAAKYEKIELEGLTAKAYTSFDEGGGQNMDLLKFNDKGQLAGDLSFGTHFSINIGNGNTNGFMQDGQESSYILEDYEWFYEPNSERWGLRNNKDGSLKISASFETIKLLPDIGFTLVGLPNRLDQEWERTSIRINNIYGLVDNQSGNLIGKMIFRHIYLEDFRAGLPFARCILSDGRFALLDLKGQISEETYTYLGPFKDGIARVARSGRLQAAMRHNFPIDNLYDFLLDWESPFTLVDNTVYDELLLDKGILYCQDCNWSYINNKGKTINKESFDFATDMVNKVGMVSRNGKWGLLGKNGSLVIPCAYDELSFLENTNNQIVKLYVRKTSYGLMDTLGQLAISAIYDEIGQIREGRLAVLKDGRWGYTDQDGKLVINCKYDEVEPFYDGYAAVKLDNKWGFIDRSGEEIILPQYKKVGNFSDGLAWVEKDGQVAYIDSLGRFKFNPGFQSARTFFAGVAIIEQDDLFGLIDTEGQFILKPKYPQIQDFDENGLAIVKISRGNARYGVINLKGDLITTVNYRSIEAFSEGLAVVRQQDTYGYINTQGELVIPCEFSKADAFSEGRAAVYKNSNCGFLDRKGNQITDLKFSRCQAFDDGRAVVYRGMKKAGLVDIDGELLIPPSINQLINFREGRGLVRDHKLRFYFITEEANRYKGYYEKATQFQNGIAVIKMNNKWGIINRNGVTLVRPKYSHITNFKDGYAKVEIDGFSGLSNINGEMIVQPGFEYISYAGEGLFRVEQGDKVGYFDQDGHWVWDLQN